MFHNIAAMYRDPKHKETLQASLFIQNLKSPPNPCVSSPPHPYQLAELKLPEEVPPYPQDTQNCPSQVWNCGEIGLDPNVIWRDMV